MRLAAFSVTAARRCSSKLMGYPQITKLQLGGLVTQAARSKCELGHTVAEKNSMPGLPRRLRLTHEATDRSRPPADSKRVGWYRIPPILNSNFFGGHHESEKKTR